MAHSPSILGAVLAGGASSRFGSDKASFVLDGIMMLDRIAAALDAQCDAVLVCGRDWPGRAGLADSPAPGLGPLGGLSAALNHALAHGYDAVLTSGCDIWPVPGDLGVRLSPGPACIAGQPLLGLWPAALAPMLARRLEEEPDRSMRGWIACAGARQIDPGCEIHNLNRPEDAARLAATMPR